MTSGVWGLGTGAGRLAFWKPFEDMLGPCGTVILTARMRDKDAMQAPWTPVPKFLQAGLAIGRG
eukprot:5394581-Pyramimonas_sp.AAC.1